MGSASQIFWFLNLEELPTDQAMKNIFTHFSITTELKEFRRDYRKKNFSVADNTDDLSEKKQE